MTENTENTNVTEFPMDMEVSRAMLAKATDMANKPYTDQKQDETTDVE